MINTWREISPNRYITYLLYSEGKNLPKSVLKAKSKQYKSLQQRGIHPKSIKSKHTQFKKIIWLSQDYLIVWFLKENSLFNPSKEHLGFHCFLVSPHTSLLQGKFLLKTKSPRHEATAQFNFQMSQFRQKQSKLKANNLTKEKKGVRTQNSPAAEKGFFQSNKQSQLKETINS